MNTLKQRAGSERGIALITVLMIAMVVAVISISAALVSSNAKLINSYGDRQSKLEAAADAGIDQVRSAINGNTSLYPTSGYATMENGSAVYDAAGAVVPNVSRWLYVGPTGITSGQYGVFGSIVSIATDNTGNKVVRRGEIVQESFAKYAYFTNTEGSIVFGGGDQIWGPVHSNDQIQINNSTPTPQVIFHGPVVTGETITNKTKGQFDQGYTENGPIIPMPTTADLDKLRTQAQTGGTAFVSTLNGGIGEATMRVEFVAVDLNGDGLKNGPDEGFIKVYSSTDFRWVVAARPSNYTSGPNYLRDSKNCGHIPTGNWHANRFMSAAQHPAAAGAETGVVSTGKWDGIWGTAAQNRCFLGGNDTVAGKVTAPYMQFMAVDVIGPGSWVARPGAAFTQAALNPPNRYDQQYLFPISRSLNANFKGVVFFDGKVAVSGLVRGKVTLAATSDIIIADDIKYVTAPGTCADMLGIFSGADVLVADNLMNTPTKPYDTYAGGAGGNFTFDDTRDEYIHGVVLALDNFTVQNYNSGPDNGGNGEPCSTTAWGRGCLYLSGGIIQKNRGAVGTTGGTGYLKRYSYDVCGADDPPPYFPTTGRFARGHYNEVDPTNFNVANYYNMLTPN